MAQRRHWGDGGESLSFSASSPSKVETLEATMAGLADLDVAQLRLQWRNHLGGTAPAHLPRWLLLRVLAFRRQAEALGGLDKATLRIIRVSEGDGIDPGGRPFEGRSPTTRDGIGLKAGTLLVREWRGKLERAMVLDKGFAWNGKTYGSLSQIAKAMTGTSWNGHRFFGLRPRDQRSGQRAGRPNADDGGRRDGDRSKNVGRKGSEGVGGDGTEASVAKAARGERLLALQRCVIVQEAQFDVLVEGAPRRNNAAVSR